MSEPRRLASPLPPVPSPPPWPLLGHIPFMRRFEGPSRAFEAALKQHGSFACMRVPGATFYLTNDPDIVQALAAQPAQFQKVVPLKGRGPLSVIRRGPAGEGLFSTSDTDLIWQQAHRILLPAMSQRALRQYYPCFVQVVDEALQVLHAHPAQEPLPITDLLTRLTFEAIAFAGFSTRYHCLTGPFSPFLDAILQLLKMNQTALTAVVPEELKPWRVHRRRALDQIVTDTVDEIVARRQASQARGEAVPHDILQIMLTSKDKVTGQRLPPNNIRAQLITLLVAGHETTSGMLSYALYYLLQNPAVEAKLIEEVDRVLGRDFSRQPTWEDMEKLDYTLRVLREALRLDPTAPIFAKMCLKPVTLLDRYPLEAPAGVLVVLRSLHRHPAHWEDPERFEPDRFLPEVVAKRHPHAYHPFGMGARACIGSQIALLEGRLVLARLYQQFRPRLANPQYTLRHAENLTLKPAGLEILLEPRPEEKGVFPVVHPSAHAAKGLERRVESSAWLASESGHHTDQGLWVLYGSNLGTCQELAEQLVQHCQAQGRAASAAPLDEGTGRLPLNRPLVVITATYNGLPPDNARLFAEWLEQAPPESLRGLRFTVLGVGNQQWRTTFQKFPRRIFERLQQLGGTAFHPLGSIDADADFDRMLEQWRVSLNPVLMEILPIGSSDALPVDTAQPVLRWLSSSEFLAGSPSALECALTSEQAHTARLEQQRELQAPTSGRSTRHLTLRLPVPVAWQPGDHVVLWPQNPAEEVQALAERLKLSLEQGVSLERAWQGLPAGLCLLVETLLTRGVDLTGPLEPSQLEKLLSRCSCPPEQQRLRRLLEPETYAREVLGPQLTLSELLAQLPSVQLDLPGLLSLRGRLKPRSYSLAGPVKEGLLELVVGVVQRPSQGAPRYGLASGWLAQLPEGAALRVQLQSAPTFHMPQDVRAPLLLVGAGTGLSPLRSMLQARAQAQARGEPVGTSWLVFGCRRPDHDLLFAQELEQWQQTGVLSRLLLAFSRAPGQPRCYVQDLLRQHSEAVALHLRAGAYVYLCGDALHMARGVLEALSEVLQEHEALTAAQADERIEQWRTTGRLCLDVWTSSVPSRQLRAG